MGQYLNDPFYLIIAGAILIFSVFFMRGTLKVVWKILRFVLILLSLLLIVGYLTGYLNIVFR